MENMTDKEKRFIECVRENPERAMEILKTIIENRKRDCKGVSENE